MSFVLFLWCLKGFVSFLVYFFENSTSFKFHIMYQNLKKDVQGDCFSSLNLLFCSIVVAVVSFRGV